MNTLLRALATYSSGPYVKKELLDETRSLKDVRQVFLRYLEIEVTDHSLLNYYSLTRRPNERPLVFYHRLRYHILQHHLPSGTVLNSKKTLAADEVISATMERFIIMEWLNRLDNRLINFIQEKFATELSASSTCLLTMVDSLAKNVDKYITQLDMASVNLLPSQANFQSPSMHSGSAEQEIGGVMLEVDILLNKPLLGVLECIEEEIPHSQDVSPIVIRKPSANFVSCNQKVAVRTWTVSMQFLTALK